MSHMPKLTMIGLYNFDSGLFDDMILPDGINKSDFINSFLLEYGERPVLYTDLEFMKLALKIWSKKWFNEIEKIISALNEEYNPLHNYDRYEEYKDTEGIETSGKSETDGTNENQVSAYNANTYQPDNKQIIKNGVEDSGKSDRTLEHEAHLYGNIGVTTSQQMLEAEIDLRKKQNLHHIISELLYKEICIYTY